MCAGSAAYKSQLNQYKRNLKVREVKWAGEKNLWAAKLARYDTQRDENVLAHSRQIGAIQRDMGLEVAKFNKQHESAYRQLAQSMPIDEGGRALGFDRNTLLAYHYGKGAAEANLGRKFIQRDERMQASNRQLVSMNNRALTERGLAPIPGVPPAKPVPKGMMEWGFETAVTVASVLSGGGAGTAPTDTSRGGFWGTGLFSGATS